MTFAVVVLALRKVQFRMFRCVDPAGAATAVVVVALATFPALLPGVKAVVVESVHEQL